MTEDAAEPARPPRSERGQVIADLFGYRVVEYGGGQVLVEWTPVPPPKHLPTVSMHVDFLRPLAVGGTYLLRGHALRVGGRLAVGDTHVTDADGQLLARATCTFSIRR